VRRLTQTNALDHGGLANRPYNRFGQVGLDRLAVATSLNQLLAIVAVGASSQNSAGKSAADFHDKFQRVQLAFNLFANHHQINV